MSLFSAKSSQNEVLVGSTFEFLTNSLGDFSCVVFG
jgi:hypothetical protein